MSSNPEIETGEQTGSDPDGHPYPAGIPVIFLTADDDSGAETRGLQAGAMDFIKKPFVPEVLLLRVRHTIDLIRLQADLSQEVEKKTQQVLQQHEKLEKISMQIAQTLSGAIDAKDAHFAICDLQGDHYEYHTFNVESKYPSSGRYSIFQVLVTHKVQQTSARTDQ